MVHHIIQVLIIETDGRQGGKKGHVITQGHLEELAA